MGPTLQRCDGGVVTMPAPPWRRGRTPAKADRGRQAWWRFGALFHAHAPRQHNHASQAHNLTDDDRPLLRAAHICISHMDQAGRGGGGGKGTENNLSNELTTTSRATCNVQQTQRAIQNYPFPISIAAHAQCHYTLLVHVGYI
jgi:hypothetical protein